MADKKKKPKKKPDGRGSRPRLVGVFLETFSIKSSII
jgi:hypothetical protein